MPTPSISPVTPTATGLSGTLPTPPTPTVTDLENAINTSLSSAKLGSITNLEQLTTNGAVNAVYKATLEDQAVIIRVAAAYELGTFQKEMACSQRVAGKLKTPHVLFVGKTEYPNHAIHIAPLIDGTDLNKYTGPLDGRAEFWKQIGTATKELHKTCVGGFGEQLFDAPTGLNQSLDTWTDRIRDQIGFRSSGTNQIPQPLKELEAKIKRAFEVINSSVKQEDTQPVLCHGNIQENNIRIDGGGIAWLIDWGTATGHDRLLDIAELYAFPPSNDADTSARLRQAFFEGYGETITPEESPLLRAFIIVRLAQAVAYFHGKMTPFNEYKNLQERLGDIETP